MIKKGQVAVFFIVAVIIFLSAMVIFFIQAEQTREEIAPGIFVTQNQLPVELDPVDTFVTECLDDVATRALILVGEHGGYIDPTNQELSQESFRISATPTQSEAVIFAPGSDLTIPYWWYLESDNKCEGQCLFSTKRPPLRQGDNSIKEQLDRYIEQQIPICLENFAQLKEQGISVSVKQDPEVETSITVDDVVVVLDYKLDVSKQDIDSSTNEFFVRIPVNLEQAYNLATDITELQQEYRFLERQTMNLIASFSAVDEEKLPPTSDLRFEPGSSTSWSKSKVKNDVENVLTSYIPLFQVDGTSNFNRQLHSTLLKQKLYDSMIVPAQNQYPDMAVTFNYLDFWPLYFDLNCNGELCQPESASSNLLSYIGLQEYNFAYDVSYPVLVEIKEEDALFGQGYRFNIFLESNVRNNKELPTDFTPLEFLSVRTSSYMCEPANRQSAPVFVHVADALEEKPLDEVAVSLSVAGESCYIGKTDGNGFLNASFPTGTAGAVISLAKPDYITTASVFDAHFTEERTVISTLLPIIEQEIIVKKKLLEKNGKKWEFTNREADLLENEDAFVSFTRIGSLEDEEFSSFATINGPASTTVRLAPGDYEVAIDLLLREELLIPERKEKRKAGLFDEVEFIIPEIRFTSSNPYPSGGLRMNITIHPHNLAQEEMILYAIGVDLLSVPEKDRRMEDLEESSNLDEYSDYFSALLRPRFQ